MDCFECLDDGDVVKGLCDCANKRERTRKLLVPCGGRSVQLETTENTMRVEYILQESSNSDKLVDRIDTY